MGSLKKAGDILPATLPHSAEKAWDLEATSTEQPSPSPESEGYQTPGLMAATTRKQLDRMILEQETRGLGMDRLGQTQTFEKFLVDAQNQTAYKAAYAFSETGGSPIQAGLFLVGPIGTGKTHLACAIGNAWTRGAVAYISSSDLMDKLRSVLDHDKFRSEWQDHIIGPYRHAGLLILDDLGVEKPSEWTQEQLFKLINHRLRTLAPTVATSNFPLDELADRIGLRVVSRLQELCQVVELLGHDRRLQEKENP